MRANFYFLYSSCFLINVVTGYLLVLMKYCFKFYLHKLRLDIISSKVAKTLYTISGLLTIVPPVSILEFSKILRFGEQLLTMSDRSVVARGWSAICFGFGRTLSHCGALSVWAVGSLKLGSVCKGTLPKERFGLRGVAIARVPLRATNGLVLVHCEDAKPEPEEN